MLPERSAIDAWKRCQTCIAFFAHCDDIECRMGGTFARLVREGRRVIYTVTVENAYFGAHVSPAPARKKLAVRREESRQGAAVLGAARTEFLAIKSYYLSREDGSVVYPTMSGLAALQEELENVVFDGRPPILNGYTIPEVHDAMKNVILDEQPQLIITQSPDDRHPDHYCTARLVSLIVEDLRQEGVDIDLWFAEPGSGGAMAEFRPDVYVELSAADLQKKNESIACFPTQFAGDVSAFTTERIQTYGRLAHVPYAEAFRAGIWPRHETSEELQTLYEKLKDHRIVPGVIALSQD